VLTTARKGLVLRYLGLALLALAVATSSLTFNWVLDHDSAANFFSEFAGRVVYLSDIFLWIGLAFWATGWYLSQGKSWRWGPWYVILPLLLLVALSLLNTLWAENAAQASYTAA